MNNKLTFSLIDNDEDINNKSDSEIDSCKGLIYRGHVDVYLGKNGSINTKRYVTPLVKKSCKGCSYCFPLLEQLNEFISKDYDFGLSDISDGLLYTLAITNVSRDWESGIIDNWDLELIEIKDEK